MTMGRDAVLCLFLKPKAIIHLYSMLHRATSVYTATTGVHIQTTRKRNGMAAATQARATIIIIRRCLFSCFAALQK